MLVIDNPAGVAAPVGAYSHVARVDVGTGTLPTSTTVEVSRLFRDGALLEVEVVAAVRS